MKFEQENRLLQRFNSAPAIRPVVAARQFGADMMEGIEGKDLLTEALRVPRNILLATWRATNQIIPTIADGLHGFEQKYTLENRTDQPWAGMASSVNKIQKQVRQGKVFGTLSAIFAEATDGPIDDLTHAVTGAPNTVIKPV